MRSLPLPFLDRAGEPIVGVLPRLGDRYALNSAAVFCLGYRPGDYKAPDDAPPGWRPRPSEPQRDEDLAYVFAAYTALCWPGGQGLGEATLDAWRKLRHELRTTSAEHRSAPHEHVVPFGELAFEALLEGEGIGQVDLFNGGLALYNQIARTLPNLDEASRLADFSQAPQAGSN